MITNYKIQNINEENILFLYIDPVEFSLSWLEDFKDFSIKKFISNHHLNFNGNKVVLVLSSGIFITLLLTNMPYKNNIGHSNVKYVPNIVNVLSNEVLNTSNNIIQNDNNDLSKDKNDITIVEGNTSISTNDTDINNKKPIIPSNKSDSTTSNNTNNSVTTPNHSNNNNNSSNKPNNNISSNINQNSSSNSSSTIQKPVSSSKDDENNTVNTPQNTEVQVTIKRSNGSTVTLGMTEYLIGVVAAEMPASFNIEALKAQAVIARTYALKRMQNNLVLTDTTSTQVYKDNNQLRSLFGSNFDKYYQKIKSAVLATDKDVCLYNGMLIDAVYHSTSNGMTEDAVNVWGNSTPYLVSVASLSDTSVSSYLKTVDFDNTKLLKLFGIDVSSLKIEILSRNQSGRVDKVSVNGQVYSGVQFRNLLGLRSSDFDITYSDNGISITTRGFGHGVGMSQYGANGMANQGYNYKQILKHYYTNISIEKR